MQYDLGSRWDAEIWIAYCDCSSILHTLSAHIANCPPVHLVLVLNFLYTNNCDFKVSLMIPTVKTQRGRSMNSDPLNKNVFFLYYDFRIIACESKVLNVILN